MEKPIIIEIGNLKKKNNSEIRANYNIESLETQKAEQSSMRLSAFNIE